MKQLTVKELKAILEKLPDNAPVYLGDDEELNGIHGAYFAQKMAGNIIADLSYGGYKKSGILIS